MEGELQSKSLTRILSKVYLSGLIPECLLKIKDGVGRVSAIDYTRAVMVHIEEPIESDDLVVGLNGISTLLKILSKSEKISFTMKDAYLIINLPNKEKIKLLTIEPDAMPNIPKTEKTLEEWIGGKEFVNFEVPKDLPDKLDEYVSLLGTKTVSLFGRGDRVGMGSYSTREKQFTIPRIVTLPDSLGEESDIGEEYYSDHLQAVLKVAGESKDKIVIYLGGAGSPLFIEQGNSWWMLSAFKEK